MVKGVNVTVVTGNVGYGKSFAQELYLKTFKEVDSYMRSHQRISLDEMRMSNVRGYWTGLPHCGTKDGRCLHRHRSKEFLACGCHVNYSYTDLYRDKKGHPVSLYRSWIILKLFENNYPVTPVMRFTIKELKRLRKEGKLNIEGLVL